LLPLAVTVDEVVPVAEGRGLTEPVADTELVADREKVPLDVNPLGVKETERVGKNVPDMEALWLKEPLMDSVALIEVEADRVTLVVLEPEKHMLTAPVADSESEPLPLNDELCIALKEKGADAVKNALGFFEEDGHTDTVKDTLPLPHTVPDTDGKREFEKDPLGEKDEDTVVELDCEALAEIDANAVREELGLDDADGSDSDGSGDAVKEVLALLHAVPAADDDGELEMDPLCENVDDAVVVLDCMSLCEALGEVAADAVKKLGLVDAD